MNVEEIGLIFRGLERILIDIVAAGSITLGWNLFSKGIVLNQKATIESDKIKIRLIKVGPGVFFAIFGTVILLRSLMQPFSISVDGDEKKIEYFTRNQKYNITKSINTIQLLSIQGKLNLPIESDNNLIQRSLKDLEEYREAIAIEKFGNKKVDLYNEKLGLYIVNSKELSEREILIIQEIYEFMNETY